MAININGQGFTFITLFLLALTFYFSFFKAGYDFGSEYAASLYRVFWKSIVAAAISVQLLQTLRYWYWEHEYQLMRKREKA